MSYKNGKDILPTKLLTELQKYIQGEIIYIPTKNQTRKGWGENNGTKKALLERNLEIYHLFKNGYKLNELVSIYNLSEDSIKKIITKIKKEWLNI